MVTTKKKWRSELAVFVNEKNLTKGVELGVYRGRSYKNCLKLNPQLELTGIDTWQASPGYPQGKLFVYEMICRLIKFRYGKRAHIIKDDVTKCVSSFDDNSLDFVHYDLFNYRTSSVPLHKEAISPWLQKIKNNGLLLGRNLTKPDIANALKELGVDNVTYCESQNHMSKKLLYAVIQRND
jgi:hypothetical protein